MQDRYCHYCSVFGRQNGTWGCDYSLILHPTPITPSNFSTYTLSVQGQHDTRVIHATNEDRCRAVIDIDYLLWCIVEAKLRMMKVRSRPHTTSNTNNTHRKIQTHHTQQYKIVYAYTYTRTNQYKRTRCSSRTNTTPRLCIHDAINADQSTTIINIIVVHLESKMVLEVKLHTVSYYCIKHQWQLRVRSIAHTAIAKHPQTYALFVHDQASHPFHTFNEQRSMQRSRHYHCSVLFGQHIYDEDEITTDLNHTYCIEHR